MKMKMHYAVDLGWEFIFLFSYFLRWEKKQVLFCSDRMKKKSIITKVCVYEKHTRAVEDSKMSEENYSYHIGNFGSLSCCASLLSLCIDSPGNINFLF